MSSYKGSYSQWRTGLDRGVGSYSSASSTSSLASTSGLGSTASKYSSLGLKSVDSSSHRSPSRESSYVSSLSDRSGRSTTPTNKFSALSSRLKESTSSYGGTKSSIGTTKDKPSMNSSSYGGVSALTSRFGSTLGGSSLSTSNDTNNNTGAPSSTFRPSGTSGYIRSARGSSATKSYLEESAATSSSTAAQKRLSGNTTSTSTPTTNGPSSTPENSSSSNQTTSPTSPGVSTGGSGLSSYKPYTPRSLLSTDIKPITAPTTPSSSLRTTARYGLKSGPSHAHYSASLPTSSTLKAAAILTEEAKKQLSKSQYQTQKEKDDKLKNNALQQQTEEATSWLSRGTCTILDFAENGENFGEADEISNDEEPSFIPRQFSPRYDGVLKQKGVQTEEEAKSKYAGLTAIPRPPLSMNFSSPFTAVMNRFNAEKSAKAAAAQAQSESTTSTNALISRRGSLKKPTPPPSANTNKTTNSFNDNSSSRSPRSSTSPLNRRGSTGSAKASEDVVTVTITRKPQAGAGGVKQSSPPSTSVVVNLANKEPFRKSVLNTNITNCEDENRKKSSDDNSLSEQSSSQSRSIKRDSSVSAARRPPTDPNKSPSTTTAAAVTTTTSTNQHLNRSMSKTGLYNNANNSSANSSRASSPSASVAGTSATTTGNYNSSLAAGVTTTGLVRIKSAKSLNPLRKLSLENNSNASDSDSTSSVSKGIGIGLSKLKKKLSSGSGEGEVNCQENNNSPIKGLLRKGSGPGTGTTCSSSASSRSASVERSTNSSAPIPQSPLHPSNLKKSLSKTDTRKSSPSSSISEKSKSKKLTIQITTPEDTPVENDKIEGNVAGANQDSYLYPSGLSQQQTSDDEAPKQTPFFLRMMGETSWVRKCQSGEIPWWMASNPDVPGTLGRNPSRTVMKVPTTKDIQEEIAANPGLLMPPNNDNDDSSSSELSDIDCDDDEPMDAKALGERTSPDGREIPSITLPDGTEEKSQLFIGSHRNIDDILSFLPANILAPSPSPVPTTPTPTPTAASNNALQEAMDELVEAQRKLNLVGGNENDDPDSDSDNSSDFSEDDDDPLKPVAVDVNNSASESESESEDDEEDDRSTGTSSSFEEVDPASLSLAVSTRDQAPPSATTSTASHKSEETRKSTGENMDVTGSGANMTTTTTADTNTAGKLDDATLQIYRDGDYGTYLDLEASISEQQEEFEGFHNNRKNSIVLRAQLPVRVHAIIEKLINADGRELRRALFSLKQIFQEDKDLVHEFVENGGLSCLIKVGSDADQNYQNYILRAIGQVMLYVDGMYGVMRHNETIQWLYSLTASKFRLVQKTALKLLLVFAEYVETNCLLLIQAVGSVDSNRGAPLWSNVMNLLREHDSNSGDSELLIYAMTLVNKVLNGIPDLDVYYDQIDALEEQGMASIIQNYMGKQCADLDLIQQFQIYEMVLKHEDGEEDNIMMQLDETMRQKLLTRKGYCEVGGENNKNRRKSRRRSSNTPPTTPNGSSLPIFPHPVIRRLSSTEDHGKDSMDDGSSTTSTSSHCSSSPGPPNGCTPPPYIITGYANENKCNSIEVGMTPGMRRRRERTDHQKSLLEGKMLNGSSGDLHSDSSSKDLIPLGKSMSGKRDSFGSSLEQQNNLKNSSSSINGLVNGNGNGNNGNITVARPWMLPIYTNGTAASSTNIANNGEAGVDSDSSEAKREHSVKDLTQKLANQSLLTSPVDENKSLLRSGELTGVVSKAKEGLAKSKSRADLKPPPANAEQNKQVDQTKKSDNDFHWDFLVTNLHRSLEICDLDFTDLKNSDDEDIMAPNSQVTNYSQVPPPLPPSFSGHPPPPPPGSGRFGMPPPPSVNGFGSSPFGVSLRTRQSSTSLNEQNSDTLKKTKKTVKLFWKEVREDPITATKVEKVGSLWTELQPVSLDTQRLEHLFESRAKDVINKKQSDANKTKEITVLDPKRSNAINIGMTKLPPPRTIKAAIMKMDSTIINREGIEKLLSMLPTEEERAKITEAQFANPETPLGSAEQFLLTLSSISELPARLKLWAFKLDYENLEKEVAEPLMDLKQGIEALEKNKTFRQILTTLLCIGNFLNGADAKGFQIDYLAKVPEVKDTVHKHSLLHHLCHMVLENYPESTDLYSEIGPVTRASRVDFDEVASNLTKMESDCKASWDHLKVIAKHDGPTNMKLKMSEFLADCAERIIVLGIIHRRVMNRFHKFLLWLGVPAHQVATTKPHTLFKIISEFALEYRTTRERVIQQLQKKASHRERNKTRGKMITEQIMYKSKEDKADAELRQVLTQSCNENGEASLTWSQALSQSRRPKTTSNGPSSLSPASHFGNNKAATLASGSPMVDGDDEILESLVKTATRTPDSRVAPRERKRNSARYSDRKSLRRTLRHGLSDEERKMLAAFMANGHTFCG